MDEAKLNQTRDAITRYCQAIRQIRQDPGHHPETSLYNPLENLLRDLASILDTTITIIQQYSTGEIGAPDYCIKPAGKSLAFLEAKEPNKSLDNLHGQDKKQLEKYLELPNLLYTNFWDLKLFQEKQEVQQALLLPRPCLDPATPYTARLAAHDPAPAMDLLARFFAYSIPYIAKPAQLCQHLARAARLVRGAVEEAMEVAPPDSPLGQIYSEFRDILFFELDKKEFADAYAQTLAYGLLLARQAATGQTLTLATAHTFISPERHRLLSATLNLLAQPPVTAMVGWSLASLLELVNQVDPGVLAYEDPGHDPLLYFYEDFLAEYDPELRRKRGSYYTPPAVVNFQTRVINRLLVDAFQRRYGLADEGIEILDPAVGTGTYLVSALGEGCRHLRRAMGEAAVSQAATHLGNHLHGFEIQVGPYAVAHYRLATAVQEYGGHITGRLPIYLTDTLLPSYGQPQVMPHFGFMSGPITEERQGADRIKAEIPIMVILGNPPYGRGKAETGWVWEVLMEDFRKGVPPEYRVDLKNLAEWYAYFYRWALWKLFEQEHAAKKGILSFITNSRWLIGGAFGGMRQMFRRCFDRIYILDLHGDGRAPLPAGVEADQNVFDIQVGVAIAVCVADGSRGEAEAEVFYAEAWGTRAGKEEWLNQYPENLPLDRFEVVPGGGQDPFYPGLGGDFSAWPDLASIFIKKFSGVETKRDKLVVAPTRQELEGRIRGFIAAPMHQQAELFHETEARTISKALNYPFDFSKITHFAYRPLDNQYLYNNSAYLDRPRPTLQSCWGSNNLSLASLQYRHGQGPVAFLQSVLPNRHVYGGHGAHIFPLWNRDAGIWTTHNFHPALLENLTAHWGREVTPEELFAYCYGVLGWEGYSLHFARELARSFPRVPFPRDYGLFQEGRELGQRLVNLHSFRERYPGDGSLTIQGTATTIKQSDYDPQSRRLSLAVATYAAPVSPEAWGYVVSGYEVLRQWVKRRIGLPLTLEIQSQLLDVIWAVEQTVSLRPALNDFGERLLAAPHFSVQELGLG
ncbi:MAG: type ISP restriction/modification enzyme [Thermodesulfobacteriota bacterium]